MESTDILPRSRAIAAFAVIAFSLLLAGPVRAEDFPVVVTAPPLSPEEQLKKFHLPPGFEIQLVAAEPEVVKPINMAFDARGRLLFTQSVEYPFPAMPPKVPRDTVQIIDGFDERGHARRISTFVDKLNIPLGVAPVPDGVIVYSTPNIYLCLDPQHTGQATERKVLYGEFQYHDTHGMNNSFTRGLDGWIYANHGYTNDDTVAGADGKKIHMQSGNTYRMRADGSHLEYFSHGRVNPFGICFDPLNNMYVADCETLPIYLHLRGAYYPSFGKPHDGLGFGPAMMDHMHGSSAIAGIVYYAATQFPPEYRDSMFIGNPVTHRINHDRLTPRGSFFWADSTADFLTCDDQWFRPVDLKLGPDGALYVADFYNRIIGHYEVPLTHPGRDHTHGRIWRIVWVGTKEKVAGDAKGTVPFSSADSGKRDSPRIPNLAEMSAEQLIERLGDPNLTVRTLATHELVDRIGKPAIGPLTKVMNDAKSSPWQRAHGLWVLQRLGALSDELVEKLAGDPDRLVRVHLVQALAERPDWNKETLYTAALVRAKLEDPDPFVRRAVVEALGRHPGPENVLPLAEVWAHAPAEDTHLIHAARIALRNQLEVPGVYQGLETMGIRSPKSELRAQLCDVSLGVATADSAEFLLMAISGRPSSFYRLPDYVHHAARYLPESRLAPLYEALQWWFQPGIDRVQQRDLLIAVQQGLQERGHKGLPPELQSDGDVLAKQLLESDKEAEVVKGIELVRELRLPDSFERLAALVISDKATAARYAAMDACVALDAARSVKLLSDVVGNGGQPLAVREKAGQALATINTDASRAELLRQIAAAPERLMIELATNMVNSRAAADFLLANVRAGKIPARVLREANVVNRLRFVGIPNLDNVIKQLTAGLPPGDDRLQKLIQQRHDGFLNAKPEVAEGRKVFQKTCTACHRIANDGHKVGPDLDGIGLRGLDRVLEDVLDPNRNVDQAFRVTLLQTTDGRSLSGLVLREEGEVVVLADAQGKEVRIAKSEIEQRKVSPLSPMPANIADQISEHDFYDLIGYLLSQTPKAK